jgi:hypothetical protein
MNSNKGDLRRRNFSKPLRATICAGLAIAITALTTQVIVSSAGTHEYQIASTRLPPDHVDRDIQQRITIARLR